MPITALVLCSDAQLPQLPWLLLGLRQQSLGPEQWSLQIAHRGSAEALDAALSEFRARVGALLGIETLALPAATALQHLLGEAVSQIASTSPDDLVVLLQPGFMPHRSLLEAHSRFHRLQAGPAIALGSNQFHPEQALSRFAMASQLEQLLFGFYPLPVQEVLPYTACRLHNLSLPLALLQDLWPPTAGEGLQSLSFCGWELGLRLWRAGWRPQALPEARSSLVAALDLDSALQSWQSECRQDLSSFLAVHPYPVPGFVTLAAQPAIAEIEALSQQLRREQGESGIPIERGDPVEQALQAWRVLLRRLWQAKAGETRMTPMPQSDDVIELQAQGFDAMLRAFLKLENTASPGQRLRLEGTSPAVRQLHQLILAHYPWIELERRERGSLLCRIGH